MPSKKDELSRGVGKLLPLVNNTGGRQQPDGFAPAFPLEGSFFSGKRILVTGGTGTIGQEVVRQLLAYGPEVVRIYSRDESKQYRMEQDFAFRRDLRFLIGDVRDLDRLTMAMRDIDLVFHCAALKHVRSCEYNPFEAVKTNILGSQNVILASLAENVQKVILTSSDKAVNPANAMGTSKLMAERLMTAANGMRGRRSTVFASVRFGNVMGSRDSVLPLFVEQIRRCGPVTITHPGMTRFIMSLRQAVGLVLKAAILARGGEVFTLRMHAVRIQDLAEVMIETLSPGQPVRIQRVGIKAGEKLFEELLTPEEVERSEMLEDMYITYPMGAEARPGGGFGGCRPPRRSYSSRSNGLLDRAAIRNFLLTEGMLPERAAGLDAAAPAAAAGA
jgi:UDP-N-acetylglucosamine 4,6-dehydratase/5-epimerase